MVGVVTKTAIVKSKNLQVLYLKPTTNFRRLLYVYVVDNSMAGERKQIEDATTDDK